VRTQRPTFASHKRSRSFPALATDCIRTSYLPPALLEPPGKSKLPATIQPEALTLTMTSVIPSLALPRKIRFPSASWRRAASGWQPARFRSGSFCHIPRRRAGGGSLGFVLHIPRRRAGGGSLGFVSHIPHRRAGGEDPGFVLHNPHTGGGSVPGSFR
jgi:hypothetical protein